MAWDRLDEVFDELTKLRVVKTALRRLLASNLPHGHQFRPIKDDDRHIIEAANASDRRDDLQRSVRCWDCRATGDKPIYAPSSDRTWGDEWHEQFEAWKAARDLLAEIDALASSAVHEQTEPSDGRALRPDPTTPEPD